MNGRWGVFRLVRRGENDNKPNEENCIKRYINTRLCVRRVIILRRGKEWDEGQVSGCGRLEIKQDKK